MFNKQMDKGILTNIDMKQGKYRFLYSAIMIILLLWCLGICLYPILWIILSGFKDVEELYAIPSTFFPKNFQISKIAKVWNEMKFWKTYGNTFMLAGGAAVFNMVISGLAGYVISKLKPIGSKVVFTILFWIMLLPTTMSTVPIYMTIMEFPILHFSMLDSFLPLWLMVVNAFDIILFKNFFDGISDSLVEAARIDGASNIRIFWQILVPLSVPVFCVVGIFTFNGNIGNFLMPLLTLTSADKTVLAVQLYKMRSASYTMDYQMLAIIFSMIPQVVVFAIFQKKIMGGINVGGVKG